MTPQFLGFMSSPRIMVITLRMGLPPFPVSVRVEMAALGTSRTLSRASESFIADDMAHARKKG